MTRFTLDAKKLTEKGYMFDTHENDQPYFTASFDRSRLSK